MGSWNPAASAQLGLLLVGPRRTGKSSSGNTLLGRAEAFGTRGGGIGAAASAVAAGRHVSVVDAQGWGSTEELVPREEKLELLRALDLCGPAGPHCVLLVIPLLDFTEPERRAVEARMGLFTSAVWRHTMVLFTFGDRLRARGISAQEHIQSGGPALLWLMDQCRYRYHVFDNKTPGTGIRRGLGGDEKVGGAEAHGRKDGGREQVKQLLCKVEDMLLENGGWHFSLHMYLRLEEEWSRREQQLRARLEAEHARLREVGSAMAKQKPEEISSEAEREERLEAKGERGGSPREEEGERVETEINGDEGETIKEELRRWSSQEEGCDSSSDGGEERGEDRRVTMKGGEETDMKSGAVQCQRFAFSIIRRLP